MNMYQTQVFHIHSVLGLHALLLGERGDFVVIQKELHHSDVPTASSHVLIPDEVRQVDIP